MATVLVCSFEAQCLYFVIDWLHPMLWSQYKIHLFLAFVEKKGIVFTLWYQMQVKGFGVKKKEKNRNFGEITSILLGHSILFVFCPQKQREQKK